MTSKKKDTEKNLKVQF